MDAVKRLLLTCGCLIVGGIPVLLFGLLMAIILALGMLLTLIPDWYHETLAQWLGLGCGGISYALSPEDEARLTAAGFDPDTVANAEAGRLWCNRRFGANIDIGILLSIDENESDGGRNVGSCDWLVGIENRWGNSRQASRERSAGRWLLRHWKKHNVRNAYVYEDYSGFIGNCRAGAFGRGQFIATTAKKVCQKYLKKSQDDDVRSCDFWSEKVHFHAVPSWLQAIKYRADSSRQERVNRLFSGWNRDLDFVNLLVDRAEEINALVGDVTVIGLGGRQEKSPELFESPLGDLKLAAIAILELFDLLPEAQGWLDAPFPPDYPREITSEYREEREVEEDGFRKTFIHYGVDWKCKTGDPIVAVGPGIVFKPRSDTLMGRIEGFGKHVWIQHPGGLYTVYAHMSELEVRPGDKIKQGKVIGLCGSTGNSTGPHIHLGVSDQHPNDFVLYGERNPGWMNPHDVLGTCGLTVVE